MVEVTLVNGEAVAVGPPATGSYVENGMSRAMRMFVFLS